MIRSHPKVTLGVSAIVGAVVALPVAIGEAVAFREVGGIFADPAAPQGDAATSTATAVQTAGNIVSLLLTFVATTILTGLLTRVLGRAVFGGRITAAEAWRMTRSRVWALLGLSLLVSLIVVLPAALVAGPLIGAGVVLDVTALVVIGGLVLLPWSVYMLFVVTRLTLAPAALVLERLRVVDALRRSWRLVRGDSWRVFGIVLLTQLVIGVVSAVVSVPFAIGGVALAVLGAGSLLAVVGTAVLLAVGQVLASILTYPFTAGVYGLLYADRRMRAEAFDLTLQAAATRGGETSVDDLWQQPSPIGAPRP
jgi:hypothetical protein